MILNALLVLLVFPNALTLEWWESGNYYQVYPRSFKDTTGNGIGDLLGVISKVPYLKELGINGVWLSPIMKSPMVDHGYDISDYRELDPLFGTLADFDELVAECRKNDIHLILDFVPNHTSDEHEWFRRSEAKEEGYEDYYIWHKGYDNPADPSKRLPPSNWISVMKGSAWTWSEVRQEFYYHAFSYAQPDLNYHNAKVVEEMKDVLRFWIDRGVSGFRIDAVENLFEIGPDEKGNFPNEPLSGACTDEQDFCYLNHIYTMDLPETLDMVYQWRSVIDERQDAGKIIMMAEAYPPLNILTQYYTDGEREGAHIPFNFEMIYKLDINSSARQWRQTAENYLNYVPPGYLPNWVLGNHDRNRIATRLGADRVDLFNVFLQTMPGHAVTYQGEEIGMNNAFISWEQTQDPQALSTNSSVYHLYSRDPVRTPMQWDTTKNAGFSTADSTWLPVNPNFVDLNVETQRKDSKSHFSVFKRLIQLRQRPAFKTGIYQSARNVDQDIFTYIRGDQIETYLIILNFGSTTKRFMTDFSSISKEFRGLSKKQIAVLDVSAGGYKEGTMIDLQLIEIKPKSALIFKNSSVVMFLTPGVLAFAVLINLSNVKILQGF